MGDGLLDEPRPGRPRTVTDGQVEQVIVKTLETTPTDATHWSTRSMASEVGLTQSAVHRIWRAFGLQPHRQETWKLSTDRSSLQTIDREVPGELAVHLVLDNASTHKTPAIQKWLAAHPRFVPSIRAWIQTWNDDPKPFVWTKTADQILESIARYCNRINDSRH